MRRISTDYSLCSKTNRMITYIILLILFSSSSLWIQHELYHSSISLFSTSIDGMSLMKSTNETNKKASPVLKSRISNPKVAVRYNNKQHKSYPTEYFPWNDHVNYTLVCLSIQNKLNSFKGPPIIHQGYGGGLGHKLVSLLHSFTTALVLKRPLSCMIV